MVDGQDGPSEAAGERSGQAAVQDHGHRWWATLSAVAVAAAVVLGGFAYLLGVTSSGETPQDDGKVSGPAQAAEGVGDLERYCTALQAGNNPYVGTGQRARLLARVVAPTFDSHRWQVGARLALARDHLRFGETGDAIRVLEEALRLEERDDPRGEHRVTLLDVLAVTYLKMGELANCLTPDGSLVCALPLDRSLVHGDVRGSTSAIETLERLLEIAPDDLKARWLLNVAHMTLGTYPDQVPERFLVPADRLESGYDLGRFDNVAVAAGLYTHDLAGGAIVEDFDNDGLLDVVSSTWDPCGSIKYFHNDGNGLFSDRTVRAGLDGQLGGLNIVQADYDNDGWMDVLVMRGGWMGEDGTMRVSLLHNDGHNDGDGGFTDRTHQAGLAFPAYPGHSAAWADYDSDGDLDLYACNESEAEPEVDGGAVQYPSQLFRNAGDGTFEDVAPRAGVTNLRYCKGATWGDYDNDDDPDLYVSNFGGRNRLYRNNGDGTFTDLAEALGVGEPAASFATWFWDYNNDGWLDIFVAGYGEDVADSAADYLGIPNDGGRPRLYRNDGSGGFVDVTREMGLYRVHLAMGANFGDLDNDGFPDFYLGTGFPSFDAVVPNVMYRNAEGRGFIDVTFSGGFGHLQKGHGIAFGDLDRDGDQDIYAQVGGFYPGDAFSNALYLNPGHGARWISVRLVGVESNRAAIGARISVTVAAESGSRTVEAQVGSGGSFGASSLEQEIGLGRARRITSLEVRWPASGIVQTFEDVPLDSHIEIREGADDYVLVQRPVVKFK